MPDKPSKKVTVKTKATTYSAVRLSMVIMTVTAMFATAIVGSMLIISALPKTQIIKNVAPLANKSANSAELGEVLVLFKAGTTELARTRTIQAALQKPVDITTLQNVKRRVGLRTVIKTVEVVSKKAVTVKSLTPVVDASIKLTSLGFGQRLARGTPADVTAAADPLKRWYVLRVEPPTANLTQVVSALVKQDNVVAAEKNLVVQAAQVARSTSGSAINLSGAQTNAYPAAGDCNLDGQVDGKDLTVIVNFLFNSGPAPKSTLGCDANRDGKVNILDVTALVSVVYASLTANLKDLTGDGVFTKDDLNFLVNYKFRGGPAPSPLSNADFNGDGSVDILDITFAVDVLYRTGSAEQNYGKGDVNKDGVVDGRDLDYLIAFRFGGGPAPSPLSLGDMNLDGKVDILDITILVDMFYRTGTVTGATLTTLTKSSPTVTTLDGTQIQTVTPLPYLLGDLNADGRVNLADLSFMTNLRFYNGPAPSPLGRGDMDSSGSLNILDLVLLKDMLYNSLLARLALADLNSDGVVNAADVAVFSNYILNGGPAPDVTKADVDNDGKINILDHMALVDYVYRILPPASCANVRTAASVTFLNGDLDGNGNINVLDLTFLVDLVYRAGPAPAPMERGDVNCDGVTDGMDVRTLSDRFFPSSRPVLTGDANNDGTVDGRDLDYLTAFLFASGPAPSPLSLGDMNFDGKVNILDLTALVELLKLNTLVNPLPDVDGGGVSWSDAQLYMDYALQKGPAVSAITDINGDGNLNFADAITFVNTLANQQPATSTIAGDADANNLVDCRDAEFLNATFFNKGPKPSPATRGDVNGDGILNEVDLLQIARRSCPGIGAGNLSTDVTVALIDTGVNGTAVDIQSALAVSKEVILNGKDDNGNGYPDDVHGMNVINSSPVTVDCNGHGTALTRLLSTKAGIASWAQVVPIKALDCKGRGNVAGVARAMVYATVRGADIAELPFSGYGTSTLLADIVKYAKASGMFVIAAAGNDTINISRVFPANVAGVFAVGATTPSGTTLTSYSNTGANVVAPGNATGVNFQGTSVSATYVAGTAALVLTKSPTLTLTQLTAKLTPKPSANAKNPKLLDAAQATSQ